ncbi:hypothetical protein BS50DRAFT_482251 [Corynespora cassiicola Philippines]|uniref:Zinc finger PHD-type domain-containing protein n=1 Tax=Corynespora cassiicola Philippines TaxID=1448308 RepID=A0A2T2P6L6_CORCC|nr:hypothetical protein BS50DRAFT_482251 [Corynespora cassiicola Philippines]
MAPRKRARDEMEADAPPVEEPSTLHKLRNMWQFANLAQYIHIFGDVVKIDKDIDIEELETECLKPHPSEVLPQIGLALLKHVSSHKGLTLEIFDEYARRQYVAKAPARNPFGVEEAPNRFNDFDVFTKIRVLQQLSTWTLNNPNTIRERMNETEREQTSWRVEPDGWDSQDRTYFILDDNRLYRRTDPPPPPPPQKLKSKSKPKPKARKTRATRSSKRRRQSTSEPDDPVEEEEEVQAQEQKGEEEDDGMGGMKWECLCITYEDYQEFLGSMRKSRDVNEKALCKRIEENIMPQLQRAAEEQARKQARKMKELETMQKLAMAKRSSRISARLEKQKEVEEAEEVKRKRKAELAMAKAEQEKQAKMEEDRESRMITREQRMRERESKRILAEEEVRQLKETSQNPDSVDARVSERHLKAEMKRREEELKKLSEEEETWVFDCEKCGLFGDNLDDGSHSIACEKCNVWQHSKCNKITAAQAERDDFHFICGRCKRKNEEAKQPKLKIKLNAASPNARPGQTNGADQPTPFQSFGSSTAPTQQSSQGHSLSQPPVPQPQPLADGPSLSPRGQALGPPGIQRSEAAFGSPTKRVNGNSSPGHSRPFSSGQHGSLVNNGFPTSSPPPYRAPASPFNNRQAQYQQPNGSPFNAPLPFNLGSSFSRPASSAGPGGPYHSPVKHSPAPSPRPSNGVPNAYNFTNSPHSSFPPSSNQLPSFSPVKQPSSPPPPLHMSSPAPAPIQIGPSPRQMPAHILPDPIPAPSKHDGARPISSHSMSETPIFPPIKALSPTANPQILSPPTKNPSPTPERPQFAAVTHTFEGNMQK